MAMLFSSSRPPCRNDEEPEWGFPFRNDDGEDRSDEADRIEDDNDEPDRMEDDVGKDGVD
jgi:hypothetical protein